MSNYLQDNFGLQGKRAVVTGAGRGIGRAIAEALAGAGAQVLVHYHASKAPAAEVVAGIEKSGGRAWHEGADLTKAADVDRFIAAVRSRWNGGLDILVNNSGDLVKRSRIEQFPDDLLEQVLRVNIHTTVYTTRAAIPLLNAGKDPCIINLSSVAAHNGGANGATMYAATKGAILTYTRGLAKELAPQIRVNGIAPGTVMTDFHRTHSTAEALTNVANNTPLKRLGTAEECAAAAVFLASKGARFITGETIEINGGLWVA